MAADPAGGLAVRCQQHFSGKQCLHYPSSCDTAIYTIEHLYIPTITAVWDAFLPSLQQRPASAELVRVDLSHHDAWRLTNSNHSIDLPTKIPAHTISVLASAGLAPDDPLYRLVGAMLSAESILLAALSCSWLRACLQQSWSQIHAAHTYTLHGPRQLARAQPCTHTCLVMHHPLGRYGERDTRWVGEEQWNFTLVWNSKKHQALVGCRRVLLVLHGIDTFGLVVLNGRHLLQADNSHRCGVASGAPPVG